MGAFLGIDYNKKIKPILDDIFEIEYSDDEDDGLQSLFSKKPHEETPGESKAVRPYEEKFAKDEFFLVKKKTRGDDPEAGDDLHDTSSSCSSDWVSES
jgi:hypothetical protein